MYKCDVFTLAVLHSVLIVSSEIHSSTQTLENYVPRKDMSKKPLMKNSGTSFSFVLVFHVRTRL